MIENSAARSDVTHPTVRKKDARRRVRRDSIIALIIGLAGFAFYAATAAPSVATLFDDSLEFQVVLPTLGIAHPSGYPLYTLLGKLFTLLLPFRDPAGRVNLLSALCAGAALAVLYLLAQKVAGNRAAAATATTLFALSPAWWSQATIAEVYALHGLFVILFLYLLLRWEEARSQEKGIRGQGSGIRSQESGVRDRLPASSFQLRASSDRWLAAAALVFGLGIAHHRMIALMLPAALVFIFWTDPGLIRQPRRWVMPLVLALAPLLFYLYLPIRGQTVTSLDGTFVPTLAGTLDWITARGYSIFLTGNPFGVERNASSIIALFLDQLGVLTIAAAVHGVGHGVEIQPAALCFSVTGHDQPGGVRLRLQGAGCRGFLPPCVYADRRVGGLGAGAAVRRSGAAGDERGAPAASEPLAALADRGRLGGIPGRGDVVRAGEEHSGGLPGAESPDELGRL